MDKVRADVRGEVKIDEDYWPGRLVSCAKNLKSIEGQPKCNVTWVFKVLVIIRVSLHLDILLAELLVKATIKDIGNLAMSGV